MQILITVEGQRPAPPAGGLRDPAGGGGRGPGGGRHRARAGHRQQGARHQVGLDEGRRPLRRQHQVQALHILVTVVIFCSYSAQIGHHCF